MAEMSYNEYLTALGKVRASRLNQITYAVNCKVPKEEVEFQSEVEEMYYDSLMKQAEDHVKKYGDWPVFEMEELDSDDPALDIYKD